MTFTDNKREFTGRDDSGRFATGNQGRPLGAKGKVSKEALEAIKGMRNMAIQKLSDALSSGERWAVELVLEKVLPTSGLSEVNSCDAEAIKAALIAGDICPSEAVSLCGAANAISLLERNEFFRKRFLVLRN